MSNAIDITGKQYGDLTVIALVKRDGRRSFWLCQCKCGKSKNICLDSLRNGTGSCGCHRKRSHFKHGYARSRESSSIYSIWATMIQRCSNPNSMSYKNYGGRGIIVCERWLKFVNFLADMGERPGDLEIERIDNNKGYSPDNCKWATETTQSRNKRNNHYILVDGINMTIGDWALKIDRNVSTIRHWCNDGKEVEGIKRSLANKDKRYIFSKAEMIKSRRAKEAVLFMEAV